MNTTGLPKKQPVPFGLNGQREDLLSTTPAGDNTASYDAGFPPVTMILKAAGGLPPKGQDMNQILFELSAIARWMNAGASYPFDATFAAAVGGYPKGAVVPTSNGTGYWLNQTENNSATPEAVATVNTGWVPIDQYGTTSITGLASTSVTLTTLQAAKSRIKLAGALTANINLIFPAWINTWAVANECTGNFSVTCKTPSGTGVSVPAGLTAVINGDGVNITQDSNLLGVPGRLLNVKRFTSSGTYTPTIGTNTILVEIQGGGGGGGSAAATSTSTRTLTSSGGAGGYAQSLISNPSASYAVTIGAGGASDTAGGATSFAGMVANGGLAGALVSGALSSTANAVALGAIGGVATGGNEINSTGGNGQYAVIISGSAASGNGGDSKFGKGGRGSGASQAAGGNGELGSGGGGANAAAVTTTYLGGNGGSGIVIIMEYT